MDGIVARWSTLAAAAAAALHPPMGTAGIERYRIGHGGCGLRLLSRWAVGRRTCKEGRPCFCALLQPAFARVGTSVKSETEKVAAAFWKHPAFWARALVSPPQTLNLKNIIKKNKKLVAPTRPCPVHVFS